MDVFRIEFNDGQWTLLKVHGYKPILHADHQAALIEHVLTMTGGKGAVIRFDAQTGVRELRVGAFEGDNSG